VRRDTGAVVEVMVVGDFNRHDQLWGGDEVSLGNAEASPPSTYTDAIKISRSGSRMTAAVRSGDSIAVGDFNRHDQLWGGDEVSLGRQGEADPIIDLMNDSMAR
jgi:hypothetical protein